ncbi:rCG22349 [Rattus norvegicus]|uniref:RCG22349 n=1 Tax=Rattus norvegicus TaxID=10116 RepID=A6IPH2_RAT|nr:rCG22349 [Rattus norvegicus]
MHINYFRQACSLQHRPESQRPCRHEELDRATGN